MKIIPTLAVIATLLGVGVGQSKAQTNVVLQLNFALTGFSGSNGPAHISTKDLIQAIGGASSNSFPANSKLVAITDISSSNNSPAFVVRSKSGTNITDTDVSGFISVSPQTDEINVRGANYSDTVINISLPDGSSIFVNGFATRKSGVVSGGRGVGRLSDKQTVSYTLNPAAGGGTWGGDTVVLRGSVSATSPKVEVVPSGM